MKIEAGKKYLTRSGLLAKVSKVEGGLVRGSVYYSGAGEPTKSAGVMWDANGQRSLKRSCALDLVVVYDEELNEPIFPSEFVMTPAPKPMCGWQAEFESAYSSRFYSPAFDKRRALDNYLQKNPHRKVIRVGYVAEVPAPEETK